MATRPKAAYAENDWMVHRMAMADASDKTRLGAFQGRQESHWLRNDVSVRTIWDTYENNIRLSDRVDELQKWRQKLQRQLADTDGEVEVLKNVKITTERALKRKEEVLLGVIGECMSLGKERSGIDHTRSEVEQELEREEAIAENAKHLLRQRIAEAFAQLSRLRRCRWQLKQNLGEKNEAIALDTDQLSITKSSADISLKPNSLYVPPNLINMEEWQSRCNIGLGLADGELRSAAALRDIMLATIANTDRMLRDQQTNTNYAYRKRIHVMQMTRRDLEYQRDTLQAELKNVEAEVESLEQSLLAQWPSLKLVSTRLDNRTRRPLNECVADPPYYGFKTECVSLRAAQDSLQAKLLDVKELWNSMSEQLRLVQSDLESKEKCIELDLRALDNRKRLGDLIGAVAGGADPNASPMEEFSGGSRDAGGATVREKFEDQTSIVEAYQ